MAETWLAALGDDRYSKPPMLGVKIDFLNSAVGALPAGWPLERKQAHSIADQVSNRSSEMMNSLRLSEEMNDVYEQIFPGSWFADVGGCIAQGTN